MIPPFLDKNSVIIAKYRKLRRFLKEAIAGGIIS